MYCLDINHNIDHKSTRGLHLRWQCFFNLNNDLQVDINQNRQFTV